MTDAQMRDLAAKAVGCKDLNSVSLGAGATRIQINTFESLTAFGYVMLDIIASESKQLEPPTIDVQPVKLTTAQLNRQVATFIGATRDIGGKIKAIKLIREQKAIGLREAKLYCDQLQAGMNAFTTKQWGEFCSGNFRPSWLR